MQAALDRSCLHLGFPESLAAGQRPAAADAYGSFGSSILRIFDVKAVGSVASVSVDGFDYGRP
jgi:hypothetical protein